MNLLKKMMTQKKLSWAFNEPVDPVALGIPDFPAIIKHPMDLRTIEGMLTRERSPPRTSSPPCAAPCSATRSCTTSRASRTA